MNDILDFNALKEEFIAKTKGKDLKVFAEKQQHVIEKLINSNKSLEEKVTHLEFLLSSLERNNVVSSYNAEELICIEQIQILKGKSSGRELSLDEVKRFDLLMKNLCLIRGQSTNPSEHGDYSNIKEAELVAIARSTTENR